MNEQKTVQEILYMLYLFQKENGPMLKTRPKRMTHREVMVLYAICQMHPDGSPVKMSDLSAYFKVTPAAVSQTIGTFEQKGWVKRVRTVEDRRAVYIQVSENGRVQMKHCLETMQNNLQSFISLLGQEDAYAMVRILRKAIDFYRSHLDSEMDEQEGGSKC